MLKYELYAAVARNLDELVAEGAAEAAFSQSFLVDTAFAFPNVDQLRGSELFIHTGSAAGNVRVIASYGPGSQAAFVVPNLTASPAASSQFYIFDRFRTADFRGAVDRAMGMARLRHFAPTQVTMTLVASQYQYAVPTGLDYVSHLQLVPTTGSDYKWTTDEMRQVFILRPPMYRIEGNNIQFDPRVINLGDFDLHPALVFGQGRPDALGTDNATVPSLLEEYLIARATEQLAARRMVRSKEWALLFQSYKSQADSLERYITTGVRGDEVR